MPGTPLIPRCSRCDYDLTGLFKGLSPATCPECGQTNVPPPDDAVPDVGASFVPYLLWMATPAILYGGVLSYALWVEKQGIATYGNPGNESEALDQPLVFAAAWALAWLIGAMLIVGVTAWARRGPARRRAILAIVAAPFVAVGIGYWLPLLCRLLGIV
jgi:hypothetical protein